MFCAALICLFGCLFSVTQFSRITVLSWNLFIPSSCHNIWFWKQKKKLKAFKMLKTDHPQSFSKRQWVPGYSKYGGYMQWNIIHPWKGIKFCYIPTTWMNLKNIIVSEINHTQKNKYVIPFTWDVYNRLIQWQKVDLMLLGVGGKKEETIQNLCLRWW